MKDRRLVLAAVLALLALPVLVTLAEAAWFYAANRSNGWLVSSGQRREYLLYVPHSYDRTRPAPLVISLHGAAMWGAAQKETSRWNELAEREGFIVVYPSGTNDGGPRAWHVGHEAGLPRDVRFIADLIDTLEASYHIDPARIYANGLSNGGGMSWVLSCTLSDRIAAVGLVAAALTLPRNWCTDPRPVPMIGIFGTADPMIPYHGGMSPAFSRPWPNVERFVAYWAERNRCEVTPVASPVATDVTRLEYPHCAGDAAVVLYTILGGGHSWPGGKPLPEWGVGPTNRSIDATSLMWNFFRAHPLAN